MLKADDKTIFHGVVFNLAVAFYVLFVHEHVYETAREVMFYEQKSYLILLLAVLAILAEWIYLPLKLSHIQYQADRKAASTAWKKHPKWTVLLIWLHAIYPSFYLILLVLKAWGMSFSEAAFIAVMTNMAKEALLWWRCSVAIKKPKPLTTKQIWMADAALVFYSCVAYTLIWEILGLDKSLLQYWQQPKAFVGQLLTIFILFTLFIVPVRLPYLAEEWSGKLTSKARLLLGLSLLTMFFAVFASKAKGEMDFQAAVAHPLEIQRLILVGENRQTVPDQVWQMTNLRFLDLSQNRLVALPPDIKQLDKLELLWLSGNPLTDLPDELKSLPRLRRIYIDHTDISKAKLASELQHLVRDY